MPASVQFQGTRQVFGPGGKVRFFGLAGGTPGGAVANITLKSNGGAWHGYHAMRLVFAKGSVTSGNIPYVQRGGSDVDAQFSGRVTYSDGSLHHCIAFIRDDDWTAPETSRTYTYGYKAGSYTDSSAFALGDITGAHDFKVTVDSCTINGTATTRSSANGDASFNTASGTPASVQELCDGPIATAWRVVDFVGTDADLQCEFWLTAFKTAAGALHHVILGPQIGQYLWKSTTKNRLDYNITVKDGTTTLASWSSIEHPYHSGYMAIENRDHVMEGRGITVGATEAQVIAVYDWEHWYECGLLDPWDFTRSPSLTWTSRYVPLDDVDHRFAMGAGASYMGRGMICGSDLQYCLLESFAAARSMRCNALVGHHLPRRYRDDTKPMRTKSLILAGNDNPSSSDYDFTADGLSSPVHAYIQNGNLDSFGTITGGTGSWAPEGSNAHLPDYSWFAWMVECDWWHLQAAIDNAAGAIHVQSGDVYRALPTSLRFDATAETLSGILWQDQVRGTGFAMMIFAHAANGCPDGWPEKGYLTEVFAHNADTMKRSVQAAPADRQASGMWEDARDGSPWQEAFLGLGMAVGARLLENADAEWFVKNYSSILSTVMFAQRSPYRIDQYRMNWFSVDTDSRILDYDGGTNTTIYAPEDFGHDTQDIPATDVTPASNTIRLKVQSLSLAVGDSFMFSPRYGAASVSNIPGGLAWNQVYYIKSIVSGSGNDVVATIATTPGGAEVNITSQPASNYAVYFKEIADEANYSYATDPDVQHNEALWPSFNYNDYANHQRCLLVVCNLLGTTAATDALCDFTENFFATVPFAGGEDTMWTYTRRAA